MDVLAPARYGPYLTARIHTISVLSHRTLQMKFLHVFNSSQSNNLLCIECVFPLSKRPQAAIGSAVGLWYTRVPRRGSENQLHLWFARNGRNALSTALARRRHRSKPRRGLRKSWEVRMSRLTNDGVPIYMHRQKITSRTLSNLTILSVYLNSEKFFSTFSGQLQLRDFPAVKSAARKLVTCKPPQQLLYHLKFKKFEQK